MANYYERSNTLTTLQGPTTSMTIVVSAGSSQVKLSPDDLPAGISVKAHINTESNADKPIVAYEKEA